MPREIISAIDADRSSKDVNPTQFKDRVVKLIPTEIITAYVTIQGLITGYTNPEGDKKTLMWIVLYILLVLTPTYLFFLSNVKKWGQIIFTTIAFLIWAMAVGSPVAAFLGFPSVFLGSILLVIYTLLIPVFYKG